MYNYFQFNGTQVNLLALIASISKPYLPSKNISTIDISSRDGLIFDGSKYASMKIKIELKIIGDSKDDYNGRVKALSDLFSVKHEVPMSFCPNTEIYGIVSSEFEVTQKNFCTGYADIEITIHNPYTTSSYVLPFHQETESSKFVKVTNGGHEPTKPFITIGFSEDSHFVQLENKTTGDKILVGNYPKLNLGNSKKEKERLIMEKCESLSAWNITGANIDSNRSTNGSFAISDNGDGIILSSMGDGATTWKGACARLPIGKSIDEFKIQVNMKHNSTGKNGDPNKFDPDEDTITGTVTSGKKETYYEVTCSRLNVRSGPGTNYKKIGSLTKGYKIKKGTTTKGWLKFNYTSSKVGYCSLDYLKKKTKTNEVVETKKYTIKNMWVMSTEFGTTTNAGCKLWSSPNPNSKVVCIIPFGTCVRITTKAYTYKYKDDNQEKTRTYYKLYKKYDGKYDGYIEKTMLKDAFEMDSNAIDYSDDPQRADDKTGVVELYGFDVNGNQIFKMGLIDDNQWFEYTRPEVRVGSRIILKDTNKTPKPDQKIVAGENSSSVSNYLSGKYGDWNEFYGRLFLTRKKEKGVYMWTAEVVKVIDGEIKKTQIARDIKYNDLPTQELNYLAIYLGSSATTVNKMSAVAVTHLEVFELNPQSKEEESIAYFKDGDVLDIDFENADVYLNEEQRNDLVDIGSTYFDIQPGEHEITMHTDDGGATMDIALKERWLGVVDDVVSTVPESMSDEENGEVI